MRSRTIVLLILMIILTASACRYLRELSALKNCEFRLSYIDNFRLAGIPLDRISSWADLNIIEIGKLSAAMARGELPLSFTMYIEVKNPNPGPAGLNRLTYMVFLDNVLIAEGELTDKFTVPPSGGVTRIPVNIRTDISDAFKKESLRALFHLVLNLSDSGNRPTQLYLKIKPVINMGKKELIYPGHIRVSTEFTSGDR